MLSKKHGKLLQSCWPFEISMDGWSLLARFHSLVTPIYHAALVYRVLSAPAPSAPPLAPAAPATPVSRRRGRGRRRERRPPPPPRAPPPPPRPPPPPPSSSGSGAGAGEGSDPQSALFAAIAARKEKQEARMRAIEAGDLKAADSRCGMRSPVLARRLRLYSTMRHRIHAAPTVLQRLAVRTPRAKCSAHHTVCPPAGGGPAGGAAEDAQGAARRGSGGEEGGQGRGGRMRSQGGAEAGGAKAHTLAGLAGTGSPESCVQACEGWRAGQKHLPRRAVKYKMLLRPE